MFKRRKRNNLGLIIPVLSGLLVAGAVRAAEMYYDFDAGEYVVNEAQRFVGNLSVTGNSTFSGDITANNNFHINAASGRVGIGTISPAYRLDVSGGTGIVARFSGRVRGANAVNSDEFVTLGQLTGAVGSAALSLGNAGQIPFINAGENDLAYSNSFVWDDANSRLGVGGGFFAQIDFGGMSVEYTMSDGIPPDADIAIKSYGDTLFSINRYGDAHFSGHVSGLSATSSSHFVTKGQLDAVAAASHDPVTLAGQSYLTLSGQEITANAINLSGSHVTGTLPVSRGGTGASTASAALANLGGVPTSRTITAGAGLTGGGNLTANRTLSVVFGTTAGTVAEGNDSRIINGQTAYGWGNHATAGYLTATAINTSAKLAGIVTDETGTGSLVFNNKPTFADGLTLNNGSLLVTGTHGGGNGITVTGSGTRMFFDTNKSAFRAGRALNTRWNDANVGIYSAAFGSSTTASGNSSTAFGYDTTASGSYSAAFGSHTTASNAYSTAFGEYTTASGISSTAFGYNTRASGIYSAAFGEYTTAQAFHSVALGRYNVIAGSTFSWVDTDPLFVIGNGTSTSNRSNAMTVLKNGNLGLGGEYLNFGAGNGAGIGDSGYGFRDNDGTLEYKNSGGTWSTFSAGGSVTSIDASGGSTGLTFSGGPITTSGTLTLGGTLAISGGGTGATTANAALANLGGVPTSRTISTGTGLTGGGNLTANRTLSVAFGTTAGTVAEGNDSRIINGQTAYSWGNHATAGYLTATAIDTSAKIAAIVGDETGTGSLVFNTDPSFSGNVGIGTASPNYELDVVGKIGINGTQMIYLPDQTNFQGSLFIGNGGGNLSHSSGRNGFGNVGVGLNSLTSVTTGMDNVAVGYSALTANTTGLQNIAIGYETLLSNTDGIQNIAIGAFTLRDNTIGDFNIALGKDAMGNNTTGSNNVSVGRSALSNSTTGSNNTAVGRSALFQNVSGLENTAVGGSAGLGASGSSITGNTLLGYRAGFVLDTGADYNTLLGHRAGDNITTGARNIIIGYDVDAPSATGSDQLNIGNTLYGDLANGNIRLAAGKYLNFGTTFGDSGYGIRDNAGTLEYKNSGGAWSAFSAAGTVTSVDASGGSTGLTFSGGPITTSGTLTLGGTLAISGGGTGATTASAALANLGGVPTSRTISAGTGLTGGGNLTANRTLSVAFGTTAGTVAEGNDSRIINGQTAFSWGNHATAGYLTASAINTSAKLAAIVTDETGTGALVFNTDPVFSDSLTLNNGSLLVTGTHGGGNGITVTGAGTRMFFDTNKSAFRAGNIDSLNDARWNDANVGEYSAAFGQGTTASGIYSTAFGWGASAYGDFGATAFGRGTSAYGQQSTAFGWSSIALGDSSTAFGRSTTASGDHSTTFGRNTGASGINSAAFGENTSAQAYNSVALGRYNVIAGSTTSWVATDPLLAIGNGSSSANRSNALTVLKNGNVGLGGEYLNFGASNGSGIGSAGYGIRDNAGVMEFRNSGGSWEALGAGGANAYLDLTDTPATFTANAIPFTNSAGTALLHSSNLTYNGTTFSVAGTGFQAGSYGARVANGTAATPSVSFSSDTNTGMYRSGADSISFATGGTERLNIDSAGAVSVNGGYVYGDSANSYIRLSDAAGSYLNYGVGGDTSNVHVGYNNIRFRTADQVRMQILSDGTVSVANSFSIDSDRVLYDSTRGVLSVENIELGPVRFEDDAGFVSWIDMDVTSSSSVGAIMAYSAQIDNNPMLTVYSQADGSGGTRRTRVAIGDVSNTVLGSSNIPSGSLLIGNGALCVDDGGSRCDDASRVAGRIYARNTTVVGIDLAEEFPTKDEDLQPAEILMFDPENPVFVRRYSQSTFDDIVGRIKQEVEGGIVEDDIDELPSAPSVAGIYSTDPGLLLGGFNSSLYENEKKIPLALSGRVPLKVNLEGGDIRPGDRITISNVPGVGRKATSSGWVVGIALEPFNAEIVDEISSEAEEELAKVSDLSVKNADIFSNEARAAIEGVTPEKRGGVEALFSFDEEDKTTEQLERASMEGVIQVLVDTSYYQGEGGPYVASNGKVGIGNNAPEYNLHVTGNIGADEFVIKTTSQDDVASFNYVMGAESVTILDQIREMQIARYVIEEEGADGEVVERKRFGFLTEDLPSDILSIDGSGIDVEKFAAFSLSGIKALTEKVDAIELRVGQLELASGSLLPQIGAGITKLVSLTVENLTIGSSTSPGGITIYDKETGKPHCVVVSNGQVVTTDGACEEKAPTPPPSQPTNPPTDDGDQGQAGADPEEGDDAGEGDETTDPAKPEDAENDDVDPEPEEPEPEPETEIVETADPTGGDDQQLGSVPPQVPQS